MKSILKKRDFRVAAGCNIVSEATRDFSLISEEMYLNFLQLNVNLLTTIEKNVIML